MSFITHLHIYRYNETVHSSMSTRIAYKWIDMLRYSYVFTVHLGMSLQLSVLHVSFCFTYCDLWSNAAAYCMIDGIGLLFLVCSSFASSLC